MTPLGHLSLSCITGRLFRKLSVPAVMAGGILPDLDFLFVFFPFFNDVHRVVTHNLLFVGLMTVLSLSLTGKNRSNVWTGVLAGGLLHLCIDSVMDNNPTNGIGVALLWPFYEGIFSPFNILHVIEKSSGWNEPLKMFRSLVTVMLIELPFYITSVFLFFRKEGNRSVSL